MKRKNILNLKIIPCIFKDICIFCFLVNLLSSIVLKKSLKVIEQLSRMLIEIFLINFFAILLFRCYLLFRVSLFFVGWYFHFYCRLLQVGEKCKVFLSLLDSVNQFLLFIYHTDFYETKHLFTKYQKYF